MSHSTRRWKSKFLDALRGIDFARRGDQSFGVHCGATVLVVVAGVCLRVTVSEWCLLLLCIAAVLAAETFNSAIESLAKAVTREHDEHVGHCLDAAAGAVLLTAMGAAGVGAAIFIPRIVVLLSPA